MPAPGEPPAGVAGRPVAGVDGCRGGWIAAIDDGAGPRAELHPDAAALFAALPGDAVVAIDIPIGLPARAPRACDAAARARLGPRRASVFPAPPRAALGATTHAEANAAARAATGRGLSVQAFHLLPKIREVDAALRADETLRARVVEVHPELSFAVWAGAPMAHPKARAEGRAARRALVAARFGADALDAARARYPRSAVGEDDLLDAFAALWSARRIAAGEHERLPAGREAPTDAAGLPMRIRV